MKIKLRLLRWKIDKLENICYNKGENKENKERGLWNF